MTLNDDAGLYREFEEALLALITDKEQGEIPRSRLEKTRVLIDNRDPRYWKAVGRACSELIARSRISCWDSLDLQTRS